MSQISSQACGQLDITEMCLQLDVEGICEMRHEDICIRHGGGQLRSPKKCKSSGLRRLSKIFHFKSGSSPWAEPGPNASFSLSLFLEYFLNMYVWEKFLSKCQLSFCKFWWGQRGALVNIFISNSIWSCFHRTGNYEISKWTIFQIFSPLSK